MGSIEPELAVPKRQKAVVVHDAGPDATISVQETDVPTYSDDEVLIRLCYSSICHTDVAFAYGEWGQMGFGMTAGNQTPGHEGVGHVVAVGAKVGDKFRVGDRVGTKWLRRVCGGCESCRRGDEHLCAARTIYGHASPGSLQQYVASQAVTTPKIPAGLPLSKAGPLLCAGVTMFRALKKVQATTAATAGDWIAIAGAGGGLGHLGVQFARKMGFQVLGIDAGDKEDFCLFMGAHRFVDFRTTPDVPAVVRAITGGAGARGVLVPTGSSASYEQACQMLAPAGTLVCIGLPPGPFTLPLPLLDIINSGYTVTGVNASRLQDIQDTLDFAALHQILPMTERLPMDAAGEAFERLKDAKVKGRIVLDLQ